MTKEQKQEFTLRISQANSTEMVVILYDMALCYLDEAKQAKEASDKGAFRLAVSHVRGCLNELMMSLHMEYEPAPALMQLYTFCIRRLALAEAKNTIEQFAEIRRVLEPLRDSYAQIVNVNLGGPVMNNSQEIYAGMTYGKGTLNVNMVGANNRGYWV